MIFARQHLSTFCTLLQFATQIKEHLIFWHAFKSFQSCWFLKHLPCKKFCFSIYTDWIYTKLFQFNTNITAIIDIRWWTNNLITTWGHDIHHALQFFCFVETWRCSFWITCHHEIQVLQKFKTVSWPTMVMRSHADYLKPLFRLEGLIHKRCVQGTRVTQTIDHL